MKMSFNRALIRYQQDHTNLTTNSTINHHHHHHNQHHNQHHNMVA